MYECTRFAEEGLDAPAFDRYIIGQKQFFYKMVQNAYFIRKHKCERH